MGQAGHSTTCSNAPGCDCALEGAKPRTRLRVGSGPGLVDAPIQLALAGSTDALEVNLHWVRCPQDPRALASMLTAGVLDIALMRTEDAISHAATGSLRICGTFVVSPQEWGLHIPSVIRGRRVPTDGYAVGLPDDSGALLMLHTLAQRPGWQQLRNVSRSKFPSVRRSCEAACQGVVQSVLWDTHTARGLVDCGEWDLVHAQSQPWPSVLIVTTKESAYSKANAIRCFVAFAKGACKNFKANENGCAARLLRTRYCFHEVDALDWIRTTNWSCECKVEDSALLLPLDRLEAADMLRPTGITDPWRLVARNVCTISFTGTDPAISQCLGPAMVADEKVNRRSVATANEDAALQAESTGWIPVSPANSEACRELSQNLQTSGITLVVDADEFAIRANGHGDVAGFFCESDQLGIPATPPSSSVAGGEASTCSPRLAPSQFTHDHWPPPAG